MRGTKDLHRALKSEIVVRAHARDPAVELVVARMQYGKDDQAFGLHARPSSFSSHGMQSNDFLAMLGFERSLCGVVQGQCYVTEVPAEFDVQGFAGVLGDAYRAVEQADQRLSACALALPQAEGWGYFYGKPSSGRVVEHRGGGDGHTGLRTQSMKAAEDEHFRLALSWREAEDGRGWVLHYTPKHAPMADDVLAAFAMLGLRQFGECPEFDFEPCWWRYFPRQGGDPFAAEHPHRAFDAHAQNFSAGLKQLVVAHEKVVPFGLRLLRAARPSHSPARIQTSSRAGLLPVPTAGAVPRAASDPTFRYDVAISFAGPQRAMADTLARVVRAAGFEVFFDGFYPEQLWGKDLTVFFEQVFRKESRFCVMLVSKEYVERIWTTRERQAAMARAVAERGNEYILPIQVEAVEVPGLLPTIGYLPLGERRIEEIAELLKRKLAIK